MNDLAGRVYEYDGIHYLVLSDDGRSVMRLQDLPGNPTRWFPGEALRLGISIIELPLASPNRRIS